MGTVAENLKQIRERIDRAAERAGRSPDEVRLVAVTKTQSVEAIRLVLSAGAGELGENYVQEAERKFAELGPVPATRHLIGHLQRNKAAKAAALFHMVQSVDSAELARELGRRAQALNRCLDVLIEVNISGEASKSGVPPEEALDLAAVAAATPGIRMCGFMGIGPLSGDQRATGASFYRLAELYGRLPADHRRVLSMGMTGDFELAIAEGSTMVRVGTGIFGPRRRSE